ncbi:unnamed protein product, partial [Cochlearia groenlandica]
MVEEKLELDRRTQSVHITYQWPSFMLMEDGKDAPPVPITKDEDLDCFLAVRVEVPMLNLCATITEHSPILDEVVESNNICSSIWIGPYFVQESMGTTEENIGVMVVYQGKMTNNQQLK